MRQCQPGFEPVVLTTAPEGDVGEGLRAAERGAEADQEDVEQVMAFGATGARVVDSLEFGFQIEQWLRDVMLHSYLQPKPKANRKQKMCCCKPVRPAYLQPQPPSHSKCNRPARNNIGGAPDDKKTLPRWFGCAGGEEMHSEKRSLEKKACYSHQHEREFHWLHRIFSARTATLVRRSLGIPASMVIRRSCYGSTLTFCEQVTLLRFTW